jgi:serine protease Do
MKRPLFTIVAALALCCSTLHAQSDEPNLRRTFVVKVFENNRDAVVNINTTQIIRQRFGFDDPFFRNFFKPFERDVKRTSLGSGFVIHSEGYVVTNAHVVDGADEVEIILRDGKHLPAKILASDSEHDLAVLKVAPEAGVALRAVTLGDSSDLMIGEPVIAIGNALGYQHTCTTGVISATNRDLQIDENFRMEGLMQTDTPINPGNSGGPLLNAYGQVVGINTAIRGDAQNIGFAIPVNRLREMVPDLLSPGLLNRADFGGKFIEQRRITPPANLATTVLWQPKDGKAVAVTSINGNKISSIVDTYVELLRVKLGDQVRLGTITGDIVVQAGRPPLSDGQRIARQMLGVEVRDITGNEAVKLGMGRLKGVLITGVDRNSPAAKGGLSAGDVIVQIGRYRVSSTADLAPLFDPTDPPPLADVTVVRQGQLGRTRLTLSQPKKHIAPPL